MGIEVLKQPHQFHASLSALTTVELPNSSSSKAVVFGNNIEVYKSGNDVLNIDDAAVSIKYNGGKNTLRLTDATAGVGLTIGNDTNLYRHTTDVLGTDNSLRVGGALNVVGSAGITIGGDTNLYRSTTDTLKTDDSLIVDVNLTVNGNILSAGTDLSNIFTTKIVNTTYSQLTSQKADNALKPGQLYRISDFHLKWWNQSTNDTTVKSGLSAEPLIVLALSGNKISHEAKSELYPQDTIYYDIDAISSNSWGTINNNTPIPDFKGWIYRRIDHKLNIDIPWDWRHITVNCCRPNMAGVSLYDPTTIYNLYNVVKNASNKLYYSIQDANTGYSLTNTGWWLPVSDFVEGDTYFSTDESYGFRAYNKTGYLVDLPANQSTRIQQPTFTSSLISQGSFSLTYSSNIKIESGHSNVIFGNKFYNNTIGNDFYYNTIGNNFNNNTIGNDFYNNIIGNDSYYNTIGNKFYNNTIGNYFYSNTIGNKFYNNTIGNDFYSNTIGNNVHNNTIGNNFYYNTIGNKFYNNTIGNSLYSNTIGNYFNNNTTGNYFFSNTIGNYFYSNTIGEFFRMNTSEDSISIGNVAGATHIYNTYNTRLFVNSNASARLSYFNNSDQLVVTDPTA